MGEVAAVNASNESKISDFKGNDGRKAQNDATRLTFPDSPASYSTPEFCTTKYGVLLDYEDFSLFLRVTLCRGGKKSAGKKSNWGKVNKCGEEGGKRNKDEWEEVGRGG